MSFEVTSENAYSCVKVGEDMIYLVVGFPMTMGQHDSICIIVDKPTKLAYFIIVRVYYISKQFAKIYLKELLRLHRMTISIL